MSGTTFTNHPVQTSTNWDQHTHLWHEQSDGSWLCKCGDTAPPVPGSSDRTEGE